MTVAALAPLLVEDKFGAGRPPFGEKFFFCELPVVALVGNTEGEVVLAAPFTNLCLVTQVAVESPRVALHRRFAAPIRHQRAAPSAFHVRNSGPARHTRSRDAMGISARRLTASEILTYYLRVIERISKNRKPDPCDKSPYGLF